MPMIQSERRSSRGADRYLLRCLLFLAALVALGVFFQQPLTTAFLTNPYLNRTIGVAFLFGVAYTFRVLIGTLRDVHAADQAAAGHGSTRTSHATPGSRWAIRSASCFSSAGST